MTTPMKPSTIREESHDEVSAIFLHASLVERFRVGPWGGTCVRGFVGFQRRRVEWRRFSLQAPRGRRIQRRRVYPPRQWRRIQRRIHQRRVYQAAPRRGRIHLRWTRWIRNAHDELPFVLFNYADELRHSQHDDPRHARYDAESSGAFPHEPEYSSFGLGAVSVNLHNTAWAFTSCR